MQLKVTLKKETKIHGHRFKLFPLFTYLPEHKAATIIQARWRGHFAREYNTKVVYIRKEIRARRAEDHIMLLRKDLER